MRNTHRTWLWRYSLTAGIVLIWMSVIIIPYGTHLQALSPNVREYEQHILAESAGQSQGKDSAPSIGVGLALSSAWQFVACCSTFAGLLFTCGVLITTKKTVKNRTLAMLALGLFICGCAVGSLLGINSAVDSLHWGYIVLSAGYLLAVAGLIISAIGVLARHLNDPIH